MCFPSASCLSAVLSRRILWKSPCSRFYMLYVSVLSCLHSQTSPFGHSIADSSSDQLLFITDTLYYKYSLLKTPFWYGHLSITDNLLRKSLLFGHLSTANTLYYRHSSACKESGVRQPGASGFCYWASEFCFQLARRASDLFWGIRKTEELWDQFCCSKSFWASWNDVWASKC